MSFSDTVKNAYKTSSLNEKSGNSTCNTINENYRITDDVIDAPIYGNILTRLNTIIDYIKYIDLNRITDEESKKDVIELLKTVRDSVIKDGNSKSISGILKSNGYKQGVYPKVDEYVLNLDKGILKLIDAVNKVLGPMGGS